MQTHNMCNKNENHGLIIFFESFTRIKKRPAVTSRFKCSKTDVLYLEQWQVSH